MSLVYNAKVVNDSKRVKRVIIIVKKKLDIPKKLVISLLLRKIPQPSSIKVEQEKIQLHFKDKVHFVCEEPTKKVLREKVFFSLLMV